MQTSFFKINNNISIAYQKHTGKTPGIIFCSGFMSDMQSTKAKTIEEFCIKHGHAFLKFDYRGHGQSSGNVTECSVDVWLKDSLKLFDELTEGPQIIVGSSMGAWIATLIARERAKRVTGLLGIAAAPDFTEDLIWEKLSTAQKEQIKQGENLYFPSQYSEIPYTISPQLIQESRLHFILQGTIPIQCKVRLMHGLADIDVPWQKSLQLAEKIQSSDIELILIKDGNHRLVKEHNLQLIHNLLAELVIA